MTSTLLKTLFPALAMICALLLPLPALATGDGPVMAGAIGAPQVLNVGGSLVVVVLVVVVLGVLYAKTQGIRNGSNGVINVIATQSIGPKEKLAIIEVADTRLLIGMTTTSVQTLHVFDRAAAITPVPVVSFSERLKSAMKGGKA